MGRVISRPTDRSLVRRLVPPGLAVGLLLTTTGCFLFRPEELTPSVVGVIESAENTTGTWEFALEGGVTVDVDFREAVTLPGARGGSDPGTLLFYGDGDGDGAWYFTLVEVAPDELPGCYWWQAVGFDDDTHIVFENGLRLPKASDFDGQGWPHDGRYDLPTSGGDVVPFCMDERGEVTAYLARQ